MAVLAGWLAVLVLLGVGAAIVAGLVAVVTGDFGTAGVMAVEALGLGMAVLAVSAGFAEVEDDGLGIWPWDGGGRVLSIRARLTNLLAPFEPAEVEQGLEPGLGRFAYHLQQAVSLAVAYWVSFHVGEGLWSELSRPVLTLVVAPFSVGFLYVGATLIAIVAVLVANPLGSRRRIALRLAPLVAMVTTVLLLLIGFNLHSDAIRQFDRNHSDYDNPLISLLVFAMLLLTLVPFLAMFAALWSVLMLAITTRFNAQRGHPVLPPIIDLCIACVASAVLLHRGLTAGLDGWTAVEEVSSVALLVGFAVVDLRLQRHRLGRGGLTPG